MKMTKATERDKDAAGNAMSILNDISSGYYPAREGDDDAPTFFDPDDPGHQRRFGTDDMGSWRRAATNAEGDIEDAIAKVEGGAA